MKIGEFAKRSGLTAYTIRYYERISLLPQTDRQPLGLGDYDATILVWIAFLCRLKTTRVPLRGMLTFVVLSNAGSGTTTARHVLLVRHRVAVRARMAEQSLSLGVFDAKIASYAAKAMFAAK